MEPSFVVPAKNVPAFAAAVQCLGKIGKELFFEMNTDTVRGRRGGRLPLTPIPCLDCPLTGRVADAERRQVRVCRLPIRAR